MSPTAGLNQNSRIFVAGHRGLVGSAVVRTLEQKGFKNILCRNRQELDLRDTAAVRNFFLKEQPEFVVLAAAKVGGIGANSTYPVEFLLENLQIQNNVISSAAETGVKKLVFLGSSCIYPKTAAMPLTEDQLLTGPFESTNEAYALAKVTGIKLCEAYAKQYRKNFISLQPTNLYGPNDYYDLENSHVIPAMILKVMNAKKSGAKAVTFWGTGTPRREFLHSDDLAAAIFLCLEKYDSPELINVGSGEEVTISELARMICAVCGFHGEIVWDKSKPDGIMRKIVNSEKLKSMGWQPKINLKSGLERIVSEDSKRLDSRL